MRWMMLIGLLLATTPGLAASVYKWVDENGRVHYSQTPPPGSQDSVSERRVEGGPDKVLEAYCRAVRNFAGSLASYMAQNLPLESAVAMATRAEDALHDLGVRESQVREVAYFVYGMESGYRARRITLSGIATLAHDSCLTGNFAVAKGLHAAAGVEEPVTPHGARSGSGWFAAAGLVVTSLHVVKGARRITLHLADGSEASAQILDSDEASDLAVLATSVRSVPGLPVRSADAGLGTEVFTIGFPHADVMGVRPKLSNGVIASTSGMRDDPTHYQISVPVQAGNSGGPLLDMQGEVIGVIASKLRANRMLERTGDLTENVNYAVKSSRLLGLLGNRSGGTGSGGTLESLARHVEASLVRIVVD
jgi:S1-C subfamily serine protease